MAKSAPALLILAEGNIVTVIRLSYFVEDTSKGAGGSPSVGETTNCKLQLPTATTTISAWALTRRCTTDLKKPKPQPVFGKPTQLAKPVSLPR